MVESPTSQGCLYFLGTFLNVQSIWVKKLTYDARYVVADDLVHRLVELLGLTILASVVEHIRPVAVLEDTTGSMTMFTLSLSMTSAWVLDMFRYVELYFFGQGQREVLKATAVRTLRMGLVGLPICIAATCVSGRDYFQAQSNDHSSGGGGGGRDLAEAVAAGYGEATEDGSSMLASEISPFYRTTDMPIWLLLMAVVIDFVIFFTTIVFLFPSDGSHKKMSKSQKH